MRDITGHNFIKRMVRLEEIESYSRDRMFRAPGSCVLATVTEVNDPEKRGRIKVVYEHLDPDAEGNVGEQAFESNWLEVSPPFEGLQAKSLIGEKVLVQLKDGDYNQGYLYDTVSLQEPTNKLIRLPVYEKGELPDASVMNLGCMAIEKNNPPGCHSFVVVVKKNGKYLWAGSSHSIMETTPLTTVAKAAVQRAAAQNSIFQSASKEVLSGNAFKPIKNKKERAILTAINIAALTAIKSPIEKILQPLEQVDIGVLENSFSRWQQMIPSASTVGDSVEKYAELVSGSPRQILQGIQAMGDLLGGAFEDVLNITNDVKKYLGVSSIGSALAEELRFGTEIQDFFPEVIKNMPRLLGVEVKRIVPGEVFGEIQTFANEVFSIGEELGVDVASAQAFLEENIFSSLSILENTAEEIVDNFLPEDLQGILPFPEILQEIISGADANLEFNIEENEGVLTVLDELGVPALTGTLDNDVLTLDTWQDAGVLKASLDWLVDNTEYNLNLEGQQVTGFFPSLGFELIDNENNVWQFRR